MSDAALGRMAIFECYTDQMHLDLVDIAQYEALSLSRSVPVDVTFDAALPSSSAIRAAILTHPLSVRGPAGGKLLKAFIKGWGTAERERVTNASL